MVGAPSSRASSLAACELLVLRRRRRRRRTHPLPRGVGVAVVCVDADSAVSFAVPCVSGKPVERQRARPRRGRARRRRGSARRGRRACRRRGWPARRRRASPRTPSLRIASRPTAPSLCDGEALAAHLAEHAEDVQHRQVDAVASPARGSRRSRAGPRTRTPRSARLRGSRRAGRRGRACGRSWRRCSWSTSCRCGSRAAAPGRRRSRRGRTRR